jgi:hypothetical protein
VERTEWTDERLDDSFDRLYTEMGEFRAEMRAMRAEMAEEFRSLRTEMRDDFRVVHDALDRINGRLFVGSLGMVVALIGVLGGIIATG